MGNPISDQEELLSIMIMELPSTVSNYVDVNELKAATAAQLAAARTRIANYDYPEVTRDHMIAAGVIAVSAFAAGLLIGSAVARKRSRKVLAVAREACDCSTDAAPCDCCDA